MARQPVTPRKAAPPPLPRRTPWPLYIAAAALVVIAVGVLALARPGNENTSPAADATSGAAASRTTPELTVDQDRVDFGDVKVAKVIKATFVLKNTGAEDLQILDQPKVRVVEGC